MKRPKFTKLDALLAPLSIMMAVLLGIGILKFYSEPCVYLSVPGVIVYMFLNNGLLGSDNKFQGVFAFVAAILTNSVVYFLIFKAIVKVWQRRSKVVQIKTQ